MGRDGGSGIPTGREGTTSTAFAVADRTCQRGKTSPKLARLGPRKAPLPSCSRPAEAPPPPIHRRRTISAAVELRRRAERRRPAQPIWAPNRADPGRAGPVRAARRRCSASSPGCATVLPPTRRAGLTPPRRTAVGPRCTAPPRGPSAPAAPREARPSLLRKMCQDDAALWRGRFPVDAHVCVDAWLNLLRSSCV
nr:uncharacterized protein LOC127323912 [Lolium perenne]